MSQEHIESTLIQSLYQSALRADYWSVALGRLCNYCGAETGRLMITEEALISFSAQAGLTIRPYQPYEVMIHCIPLLEASEQTDIPACYHWLLLKPAGLAIENWVRTTVIDLGQRISKLADTPHLAWLVLQSPVRATGDFAWVTAGLIHLLEFHVRMAVLLFVNNNIQFTKRRAELAILNKLNIAIAWLTHQGVVTHGNQAFATLIAAEDGLYLRHSALSTQQDSQCGLFIELGRYALRENLGGVRILQRPSGKKGYQLGYMPLVQSLENVMGQAAYLIFILDPHSESAFMGSCLEHGYGLSKAESRLAAHICRGITIEEYAEQEQLSVATVRTQLRSIYKRIGLKGQSQLSFLLRGLDFLNPPENLEKRPRTKLFRKRGPLDMEALMASVNALDQN